MIEILLSAYMFANMHIIRDGSFDNLRKLSDIVNGRPLTFIDNIKFLNIFKEKHNLFSCVITSRDIGEQISFYEGGLAFSDNPKLSFIEINNSLPKHKIESLDTIIGDGCQISKRAHISKKGVVIGNNVIVEDNVCIYSGVKIEDNVIIKYGSLLGCEDYERCRDNNNHIVKADHRGLVRIENDTQIDEYVIIDRPLFDWDFTAVGSYSYIGKRTYISHGTKIGSCVFISPCVTVSGNTIIEDNSTIGMGAVIGNRLVLGCNSVTSIGSVVNKNILPNERVTGNLAIPHDIFIENLKKTIKKNDKQD